MGTTKKLAAANPPAAFGQPCEADGALEAARGMANDIGPPCHFPAGGVLLTLAIGQIQEAVVITDAAATIQYVNPAFTRITGYSADEVIGQNIRLLKSDRQGPAYYEELWKTILSGKVWQGELINRRKDGALYTEEMSITPVRDPRGAITHFIAIQQDVTDRRVTEAALHSSEKSLEEVQHIAPLGSWELDLPASEFHGSAGFFRIFDWPPSADTLPFGKVAEAIPAADRERINKALRNTLETQEPFDLEHQVVRGDGTVRVVRSRGQIVAESGGKSARLVGTTLDITDGKLAHEKLRQSEERYRALITSVPDVVWTSDATGNPIFVSPNCERVYGYTPEETCTRGFFFSRIHPDDHPRIAEAHHAFLQGHAGFDEQFRIQRKDGEWIWIHDKAVAGYEDDGKLYTHGIISDITERRLMEESLRQSEERYRRLFEAESDALLIVDSGNGRIRDANAAALNLYGYNREEFLSLTAGEVSAEPENTRAALADCQMLVPMRWHRKKDGTVFPVEIANSYFVDQGRKLHVAAIRDITDRKRAEEELRLTQFSVEHASDAVHWLDSKGRIVYVNEATCRTLGYSREELLSFSIPDIDPLFRKEVWGEFWETLKARSSVTFETQHRTKQGTVFPIEVTANYMEFSGKEYSFAFARDITERKQTEKTLREANELIKAVVQASPEAITALDSEGLVRMWNPGAEKLFGWTAEEVLGRPIPYVPSEDRAKHVARIARTAQGEPLANVELRRKRKDGTSIDFLLSTAPMCNAQGEVVAYLGVMNDITARKRAEEALIESEAKLKEALLAAKMGVWEWTRATDTVTWNENLYCIAGRDPKLSAPSFENLQHIFAPESWERLRAAVEKARASGIPYELDLEMVHPDGSKRWVIGRGGPARDACGLIIGLRGTVQDVTERKQAEKVLEEHTAYLNALIEISPLAIAVVDWNECVQMCNPAFERLFQYRLEEIVGVRLNELIASPELLAEADEYSRRSANGDSVMGITRRRRKDGTLVDVELHGVPLMANGKYVGTYGLYQDITERKQAEEEMRKAKEAAEAANRAKSEFLANMSHEIRTPMNGVIGMAGLLLDTELTPEQQQYAEIVRTSGEALLHVIDDILDFSKIEARKLRLEIIDFDLYSVLEYAADVLAFKASEKGVELTCELEPGTPWRLRGDPGRVRQVLLNLLGNAVKFTPQGEVAIHVQLEAEDERTATLRFTVSDTGIGFPQDRADTLFEPFVQADGSRTRRYGGTGLGLAIAKQLVEMMGGGIGVKSEEGRGSTFWFTAVFAKQSPASAPVTDLQPRLRDAKVLVVDDNASSRSLLCRLLHSWSCRPQESADGDSALEILRQAAQAADPFQIALLDMSLPGMDGEELGRRIAADPQFHQTALVLMTSFGQRRQSDWARLRAMGFAGHVSKPIWARTLREALLSLGAKGGALVSPSPQAVPPLRPTRVHGEARILVAEDNLTNQEVAVALLKKLGYHADLVANGVEALRALHQADYDVVLMDCEMPEMDGYEASRRIRDYRTGTRHPQIPIIALTADALSGDREKCLQAGMSDYLAKPVEARQLAAVLEKWLSVSPVKQ